MSDDEKESKMDEKESKDDKKVEKSDSITDLLTTLVQKQDKTIDGIVKSQESIVEKLDILSKAVDADKSVKPEHGMEAKPKVEGDNVGDEIKAPNEVAPDDRHGIKPESGAELTVPDKKPMEKAEEKKEEVEKMEDEKDEKKDYKKEEMKKSQTLGREYDYQITHTVKPMAFTNKAEGLIPTGYQIMKAMFNGYEVDGVKKCANVHQVKYETLARLQKGDFGTGLPGGDAYLV